MGSTMKAHLRRTDGGELHLLVSNGVNDVYVTKLDGKEVDIDLHFTSHPSYVSISGEWPTSPYPKAPAYFTITCVADFMWFLLALDKYYGGSLALSKCRPDPFFILED